MGLFDFLRIEYSLPGDPPSWSLAAFQTKDLGCLMQQYIVTADGKLVKENGRAEDFTGTVNFYTSNVVAMGPGIYTEDGEDARWLEYGADFTAGQLTAIREVENRTERAAKFVQHGTEIQTIDDQPVS